MKTIYLNKYKTYNNLSEKYFPEINSNIKQITMYGNCINLFGFTKLNNNTGNNLKRLGWLIKAIQNNIEFIIAGTNEDKQYIEILANNIFENYNIKLKFIFIDFTTYKIETSKKSYYNKSYHYKRDIDMKTIGENSTFIIRCYIKRKRKRNNV